MKKKLVGEKTNPYKIAFHPKIIVDGTHLIKEFNEFVETCIIYDTTKKVWKNIQPITLLGFCNYVGMSRFCLWKYSKKDEYKKEFEQIRDQVENFAQAQLFSNRNSIGVIFNLKNNHNYVDKLEQEVKITNEKIKFDFGLGEETEEGDSEVEGSEETED